MVRLKLFRGASAEVWERHAAGVGWPPAAAALLAAFLVGNTTVLPSWPALHDDHKEPARGRPSEERT